MDQVPNDWAHRSGLLDGHAARSVFYAKVHTTSAFLAYRICIKAIARHFAICFFFICILLYLYLYAEELVLMLVF